MSIIGSNILAGASGSGVSAYEIEQSLRFNTADSARLYRTLDASQTRTYSFWYKYANLSGGNMYLFHHKNSGDTNYLGVRSGGSPSENQWQTLNQGASFTQIASSRKYRDPSAWQHVLWKCTSTNVTMYVNGVEFASAGGANTSLSGGTLEIGARGSTQYFGGYIAEFHLVDGSALDPDQFGEYDDNGVWRPIAYTGSYGTNGFYLKFDPTATNGIGHDHSGNGNNFTPSGFNTSGTGTDVMSDTPTTNWCTLNPLSPSQSEAVLANGNLDCTWTGVSGHTRRSTIAVGSGKWYAEITRGTSTLSVGLVDADLKLLSWPGNSTYGSTGSYAYRTDDGNKYNNGSGSSYGSTVATGDVIGIAYDGDNGALYFSKNGIWQNSGDPTSGASATGAAFTGLGNQTWTIACGNAGGSTNGTATNFNFGQREFANPPGTIGATDYFNTVTWTGNGSSTSREITGCGFQPDLVWIKGRSVDGSGQRLQDVVRGAGTVLQANSPNQEFDDSSNLGAFTSDGFTLTTTGSSYNQSSATYVAWCWKAGGTAAADNSGTIDANVSANQDAGFSIVSWSGTGSTGTLAHGLDAAPKFIIVKDRDAQTRWIVYHEDMGNAGYVRLDEPSGFASDSTVFNSTSPTSSLFTVGTSVNTNPSSGNDMIAYCWTEKTGVSKFGEYTGNGSSDGPVISCGFRPAMVIIKWYESVNTSESWHLYDNKRGGNPNNTVLFPDAAADEESPADRYIQFTSDGFQLKSSGQQINRSGAKYIFMAWAATFAVSDDFKSLNTANLPEPDIKDGGSYFDTATYSGATSGTAGAGTTQTVTGLGFSPDLVWIKNRSNANSHGLFDQVRGAVNALRSDLTNAEATTNSSGALSAFNSNGFTLANGSSGSDQAILTHQSGYTYVAWAWDAGGTGSSNTDGSITSTVSANPSAGFSIVKWTGTGADGSVGHGLGVAPKMLIVKDASNGYNWYVFTTATGSNLRFEGLNTDAAATSQPSQFTASSTVISNLTSAASLNTSGATMLMYCFSEVEGYSKIGSFVGTGSADGPFVFCGFRPAYVWLKGSTFASNWNTYDLARSEYNAADDLLRLNSAAAEVSDYSPAAIDLLSNGFKIRTSSGDWNSSGQTFVFCAFAENPFGGSGISPATAR
jgi:hypothetical protein